VVKRPRPAGGGPRTPWPDAGYWRTTTLAGGPARSLREREGERGLVVSGWRQRERGLCAVPGSRQPEMREDPVNDGGVIDRGDQPHAAGTGFGGSSPTPRPRLSARSCYALG
jgi:hypothetical protein